MSSGDSHGRHFEDELERLKARLLEMGGLAEEQVRLAVKGLVQRDRDLIARVLTGDDPLNALHIEVDGRCFTLMALHQPMPVDLRAIVTDRRPRGRRRDFHGVGARRAASRRGRQDIA